MSDQFNPADRQREKQVSREKDAERLRSGEISRDDLRRENGLFSSLAISDARIINRRFRVKAAHTSDRNS